ncbi:hypothetical protein ACEWY4_002948 [Coilia grayii]|uniref:Uncharacterized protein n=1 Tax=Coilia grayii TaxID=363190 RepID=A0ABD1KPZ7_9TELE
MEASDHSRPAAESPCLPDNSEMSRYDLLFDIMRLPMTQFQAICDGIQNNMSPEELSKMVSSWTEDRFKKNIIETLTALEERVNILSSSFHNRSHDDEDLEKKVMTGEVCDVQLAPVTKDVFVTVLDSLKAPTPDETKVAGKEQFIGYLHGTVNKMKDFPKLFKAAYKQSKTLNITPAVCESLSELLTPSGPEGKLKSIGSTTSLHENTNRLCSKDELIRASKSVSSILMTPGGSGPSLASVSSVHDNAHGIVDTIVTDIEDLYESLESKDIEMLQSQSLPTQTEPSIENNATQKKFYENLYSSLGSAQVKLRAFFTIHRSQDITPDSDTDLSTKDMCHDDIHLKDSCSLPNQSDAEATNECVGLSDGNVLDESIDESAMQVLTDVEQQSTMKMSDSESCEKEGAVSPPASQPEAKDKKSGVRKELKIFLLKDKVFHYKPSKVYPDVQAKPQDAPVFLDKSILFVSAPEPESMDTSSVPSQGMTSTVLSSQTPPQDVDISEKNENISTTLSEDQGNDLTSSPGFELISQEGPPISTSSPTEEVIKDVITTDNKNTMGKKFKRLFAKSPKHLVTTPTTCEATEDHISSSEETAFEICTSEAEAYQFEAALQSPMGTLPEASSPDDIYEVEGTSKAAMKLDEEHQTQPQSVPTEISPETKCKHLSVSGKLKTLFAKSSKPLDVAPAMQVDESVPEVAVSLAETLDVSCAPDAEAVLQLPMSTCSDTSCQHEVLTAGSDVGETTSKGVEISQAVRHTAAPIEISPEIKFKRPSVRYKFKMFFAIPPKPVDVEPAMQVDDTDPEAAISLAETLDASCTPDADEAVQSPVVTLPEASAPDDIFEGEETSKAAMKLDKEPQSVLTETSPETKYERLSVGDKFKTLFAKSPKPLELPGPAMQVDETIPAVTFSLPETLNVRASDVETALQPPMSTCSDTSCKQENLTTGERAEISHGGFDINAQSQTSQISEIGHSQETSTMMETPSCVTAVKDGITDGSSHKMGKKQKQLFSKRPKITSSAPAEPVSQEAVNTSAVDNISPKVTQLSEAALQQSDTLTCQSSPHENIFEINGPKVPPVSKEMGPSSDMTSPSTKANLLNVILKLKHFFFHPKSQGSPQEAHDIKAFHTISEATLALKDLTDRMVLHVDDDATASARLDFLMSCGVLRPFTDDLVNRVYGYLSAIGSSAPCAEPFRFVSESGILETRTTGELRRGLVKRDFEMTRAFTEGSVKVLVKQLLERLLPLSKDVNMTGCHVLNMITDIIAKDVANTISLDHLILQREDTEVSNHF